MNEFYCEQCGSCFTRQEHLARHARTHTKEKPHACFDCGKKFSRLDALRRHTASHTARETAALARACRQCAASRVRCTRELPCRRCSEKSLPCQYPQSRKRGKVTARLHESPTGGEEFAGPSDVTAGDANVFPTTHAIEQIGGSWSTANDFSQFDHIEYAACGEEQTSIMSSMNWLPPAAPMAMDLNWTTLDTGISVGSLSDELGLSSVGNTIIDTGTCNQADRPPPLRHNETSLPPNEGRDAAQRDTEGPSVEDSLPSPQSPDTTATGKATLYVDGALTRLPFKGRCIESFEAELDNSIGIEEKGPRYGGVNDPTSCGTESPDATSAASSHLGGDVLKGYLSADAFSNLVHQLHSLLVLRDLDVSEGTLPMLGYMRAFLRLFFRRFHPAWPFLPPALSYYEEPCRWLLLLAVTAVGSKYAPGQQCAVYSTLLCDLLAKSAPHLLKDVQTRTPEELVGDAAQEGSDLPTIQAAILDIICKSHNFRTNSRKEAFSQLFMIAETCRDMGMLEISDTLNTDRLPDDMLRDWTVRETRIRTGLMIWVLDSTIAFELSRRPLFCLDDASGLLPCRASLWENPSAENIIASERYSVTIPKALEILYLEKGLPPNLDELGTNVLICAIYRRTKEAFNQYQKPLASWTPTAHVQHWQSTGYRPHEETWPPTLPILSKWRNSACDCLDILHWNANGTIAKAGGWEHPAVLNLHLSRLIILTPMQDLQRIAASDSVHGDYEEKARNRIKEWVFNDQHKARLSVVHAGALLWHARRYRTGSFLEPFGVFMATMVIWAYSSTLQLLNHQQGQPMSSQASRNRVSEEELDPAFLHLDRPLDDELVQEFILSGFSMAGHISGVGDIRKADAPRKILIMGSRLLASLRPGGKLGHEGLSSCGADVERSGVWGIEKVYIERLERLKASMASK